MLNDFDAHLRLIATESAAVVAVADDADIDDPVITCPDWTLGDLLVHIGGVHRWATTIVGQGRRENVSDDEDRALMSGPPAGAALLDWFTAGAEALLDVLRAAPEGLAALIFLNDAPPARRFWARRMAHETTIHRVDALSATLGRLPTASQAGIAADHAVDGIDELLTGFLTRRGSKLRTLEPLRVSLSASDVDASWTVVLSPDPPVTTRGSSPDPDAVLTGTAAALYLGLWNRGDEMAATGDPEVLGLWREKVRIRWA